MVSGLVLVLLALVSLTYKKISMKRYENDMKEMRVLVPFVFSPSIDPRGVHTVGDQLVSEHVYAYHYSASVRSSILPLFSEVIFDKTNNKVIIEVIEDVVDSDGGVMSYEAICLSIKKSLDGTQHTQFGKLVRSIKCEGKTIQIDFKSIPVNLSYWLRSTDFAITDIRKHTPISKNSLKPTTGPYFVTKLEPNIVELNINKNFPEAFRSNSVEKVILQSYAAKDVRSIINNKVDLAYIYGYTIDPKFIDTLKDLGYKVQIFPNEWLIYLGFNADLAIDERRLIGETIDQAREQLLNVIQLGNLSYSTTPGDRGYGLSKMEYLQHINSQKSNKLSKRLVISTLDEWISIPVFKLVLEILKYKLSVDVKLVSRAELGNLYSSKFSDLFLSPMGISAADPLGNYSFLNSFYSLTSNIFTEERFLDLYQEKDYATFASKIKILEKEIIKNRLIIPIGHFPGIVIESPRLHRDELKSWDWGIQTWTYKIN